MPDMDTLFLFGSNPTEGHPIISLWLKKALFNGAKLIVGWILERPGWQSAPSVLAEISKPGSNIAMLNGLINVILENGWENMDFIAKRTEGFDELKAKVREYDLDCRGWTRTDEVQGKK